MQSSQMQQIYLMSDNWDLQIRQILDLKVSGFKNLEVKEFSLKLSMFSFSSSLLILLILFILRFWFL
jgi:hypothetical protein